MKLLSRHFDLTKESQGLERALYVECAVSKFETRSAYSAGAYKKACKGRAAIQYIMLNYFLQKTSPFHFDNIIR